MEFKNSTDKLVGFFSPELKKRFDFAPGVVKDVPDEVAWRAESFGLELVEKKKEVIKKVEKKVEEEVVEEPKKKVYKRKKK